MRVQFFYFWVSKLNILRRKVFKFRWWVWFPLFVTAGLILSTGPMVQRYLIALLTSDETSIYGSSFERNLVRLPNLNDWFNTAVTWPHPAIALIVVLLSITSPSIRQIFLKFSLFGGSTLFVFDIIYGMLRGDLSTAVIFENLVSNFIGSIGVASIVVLILYCANYGFSAFSWPLSARRGVAGSLAVIFGALSFCAIFYLSDFFYRPRPANIVLIGDAPTDGFFIARSDEKGSQRSRTENDRGVRPFSLISRAAESVSANWRAPDNAKIKWSVSDSSSLYDVEVSLFTGCGPADSTRPLPPSRSPLVVRGVRNLSLWHDWGAWDATISAKEGKGSADLIGAESGFFWIEASDDSEIDLAQFVTKKTELKYSTEAISVEVFMIAPPIRPEEAVQNKPNLNIEIDGKLNVISLPAYSEYYSGQDAKVLSCRAIPSSPAFQRQSLGSGIYIGMLGVKVVFKPNLDRLRNNLAKSSVTVQGDSGWVRVKGVDPKALRSTDEDRLDMISISGNFKDVVVNGSDRSPKIGDNYVAIGGRIRSSFVASHFKVSGDADLLWINRIRANQIKWENLPSEYRVGAVGLIGAVLVFLAGCVMSLVKKDDRLTWMEDGQVDQGPTPPPPSSRPSPP